MREEGRKSLWQTNHADNTVALLKIVVDLTSLHLFSLCRHRYRPSSPPPTSSSLDPSTSHVKIRARDELSLKCSKVSSNVVFPPSLFSASSYCPSPLSLPLPSPHHSSLPLLLLDLHHFLLLMFLVFLLLRLFLFLLIFFFSSSRLPCMLSVARLAHCH